jgi:hypothetical protein
MNIFQCSFEQRLRDWKDLRSKISDYSIPDKCIAIDAWWQMAPLVTHHLHPLDQGSWPDPWTLLSENMYCLLTRALGIVYTLEMSKISDISLVIADDKQGTECPLVLVDSAKYVLNYWPNTVLNNCLKDFKIKKQLSLDSAKRKIK